MSISFPAARLSLADIKRKLKSLGFSEKDLQRIAEADAAVSTRITWQGKHFNYFVCKEVIEILNEIGNNKDGEVNDTICWQIVNEFPEDLTTFQRQEAFKKNLLAKFPQFLERFNFCINLNKNLIAALPLALRMISPEYFILTEKEYGALKIYQYTTIQRYEDNIKKFEYKKANLTAHILRVGEIFSAQNALYPRDPFKKTSPKKRDSQDFTKDYSGGLPHKAPKTSLKCSPQSSPSKHKPPVTFDFARQTQADKVKRQLWPEATELELPRNIQKSEIFRV